MFADQFSLSNTQKEGQFIGFKCYCLLMSNDTNEKLIEPRTCCKAIVQICTKSVLPPKRGGLPPPQKKRHATVSQHLQQHQYAENMGQEPFMKYVK